MNLPEGYVALEFVGFTDKGEYSSGSIYMKNDLVHIDNSIWKCLEDNITGIAPGSDDGNWEIFMRSASEASGILATDTEGIAGEKNEKVSTQILLDEITGHVNRLRNPEFEDYTGETQIPEPDDAIGMLISGKPIDVIHQYTKASLRGILTVAKKALNIALGKNQARVFASVADLDAWLAVPSNTEKLNVGDNFYIVATDVPDYWWDGAQKQRLETQKVDLTTYNQRITANANAISDLTEKLTTKKRILPIGTYKKDVEYACLINPMQFILFSPVVNWQQCPISARCWYSDGWECIDVQRISHDTGIASIRCFKLLVNVSTGKVKVADMWQTNIQNDGGIYTYAVDHFDGIELFAFL